jgi:hypothetical protein
LAVLAIPLSALNQKKKQMISPGRYLNCHAVGDTNKVNVLPPEVACEEQKDRSCHTRYAGLCPGVDVVEVDHDKQRRTEKFEE